MQSEEVIDTFTPPTDEERQWSVNLVGWRISIYWDGDDVFYPALVTKYDNESDKFLVLYENDDTGIQYVEDLRHLTWKLCRQTPRRSLDTIPQVNRVFFIHCSFYT